MRACTKCGEVKPLEAFPPVRRGEPKLQTWCRDCFAAYGAEYYRKNREAQKARLLRNATARRNDNRLCAIAYLRTHPCVDCGEMDIVVLQFDHLRDKKVDVARMINSGSTWEAIEREIGKCEVRCANCHRLATARRHAERKAPAVRRSIAPEQLALDDGMTRICRVCRKEQLLTAFGYRLKKRGTRHWICLSCQGEVARAWYLRRVPGAKRVNGYGERIRQRNAARVDEYLEQHACVDCGEANPAILDFDDLGDKTDDVATLVVNGRPWAEIAAEVSKCEVRCANCHARKTAERVGSYRLVLALTATPERIELSSSVP
jgi:hypothetical protein